MVCALLDPKKIYLFFIAYVMHHKIQGGDPTGTGRGGQSAWGKPFYDEVSVLCCVVL